MSPDDVPLTTLPSGPGVHLRLIDSVVSLRAALAPIFERRESLPYHLTVDLRVIEIGLSGIEDAIDDVATNNELEAMALRLHELATVCASFKRRVEHFESTGR